MTSLVPAAVNAVTTVGAGYPVPIGVLTHAVRRDLDRLTRVLAEPVTAVRRDALARHIAFVLDEMQALQRLLGDEQAPPVAALRRDPVDPPAVVRRSHHQPTGPIANARRSALEWRTSPEGRLVVLSALRDVAAAPLLDQDAELMPPTSAATTPASMSTHRWTPWTAGPTKLAKRTFWLLDGLDPRRAALLTGGIPRGWLWILRNGFSGAYNRSAYLMWEGGGTGPAV